MKFGTLKTIDARGAILAHSCGGLKKGRILTQDDLKMLCDGGFTEIIAAQLGVNDVHEDDAAKQITFAAGGQGCDVQMPFTGRANLYAQTAGLVQINEVLLHKINSVHEAITVSTLKNYEQVAARQMVATVKIIPFSVPKTVLHKVLKLLESAPLVQVYHYKPKQIGLILTQTKNSKVSLIEKSKSVISDRLAALGSVMTAVDIIPHESVAIAQSLLKLKQQNCSPILILGASAIVDRKDVVPQGLKRSSGKVLHLGMPVDPGNLLMLGALGDTPVIGVPTCARSPKLNGFDLVLQRLCCDIAVTAKDIMAMGNGGLLAEISTRPQPREAVHSSPLKPRIAAVVLAAGKSTRMGSNKLLAAFHGCSILAETITQIIQAGVDEIIVVTGHMAEEISASLAGLNVKVVHNPDFAIGISSSIRAGVTAIADMDAAFICLGDMPLLQPKDLQVMMAAFNPSEGRILIAPVKDKELGNPILWGRDYFEALLNLEGDRGARGLLEQHRDEIVEIQVSHDGILRDCDTPEDLATMRASFV